MDTALTIIISVFVFILGTVMSSFGGVVAYRIPRNISLIRPNSRCMTCGHELSIKDNIPIVSYLALRGRCRYCKTRIGITSFLMEVMGGLAYLSAFLLCNGDFLSLIYVLPLITVLQIISWEDIERKTIENSFLWVFLGLTVGYVIYECGYYQKAPWSYLIGFAIGLVFFLFVKGLGFVIYKRDALGTGDVILVSIGGLLLGYEKLLLALVFASVLGSIIELIRIAVTKKKEEIPFAPYLSFGIYFALVFGYWIIDVFFKGVILHGFISM